MTNSLPHGTSHKQNETPRLIAISGKQYAGKDTLAALLKKRCHNAVISPIAAAIKTLYAQRHGISLQTIEANKAHHRAGLVRLGSWGRSKSEDFWLQQALQPFHEGQTVIIPDLRLASEYNSLQAIGAYFIRIEAPREHRQARGHLVGEDDPTETELDGGNWHWDAMIINDSDKDHLNHQLQQHVPWF
ncbi:MAG: hypothetical protein VKK59_03945 [Vampirovibrionales bacterium]|nr:hypothetical protein [Vampirovibrionales bacterium]